MIRTFVFCGLTIFFQITNAQSIGTGFFINSDGYIATNYHVVENSDVITIKDNNKNTFSAYVVATDIANDLAILKIDSKEIRNNFIKVIKSDEVEKGRKVFTLGFPNITLQGVEIKYTDGAISSTTGILDQPNSFQVSVPVQPGNSGGPLIDSNGNAVGIIVSKLNAKAAVMTSGSLPENINYAVKSNYLIELARSKRISLENELWPEKLHKIPVDVISQSEKAVVLIATETRKVSLKSTRKSEFTKELKEIKSVRIAVLPPNSHKLNKGFFDSEEDSIKKWRSLSLNFAYSNGIDFLIIEGGAFVKGNFEIQPQEVITNSKIGFERYRNPKIFFINSKKVLEDSGMSSDAVNRKFFQFAGLIGADVILSTAVYASGNSDITNHFLSFSKDGSLPSESFITRNPNIRILNNASFFETQKYKDLVLKYGSNTASQIYLRDANDKIIQFSQEKNIDLIFQFDTLIPSMLDITVDVLNYIDEN